MKHTEQAARLLWLSYPSYGTWESGCLSPGTVGSGHFCLSTITPMYFPLEHSPAILRNQRYQLLVKMKTCIFLCSQQRILPSPCFPQPGLPQNDHTEGNLDLPTTCPPSIRGCDHHTHGVAPHEKEGCQVPSSTCSNSTGASVFDDVSWYPFSSWSWLALSKRALEHAGIHSPSPCVRARSSDLFSQRDVTSTMRLQRSLLSLFLIFSHSFSPFLTLFCFLFAHTVGHQLLCYELPQKKPPCKGLTAPADGQWRREAFNSTSAKERILLISKGVHLEDLPPPSRLERIADSPTARL